MSRFMLALLVLLACSRAMHAAPDGAMALTMEMRNGDGRAALVFYVLHEDGLLAYRIGVRMLQSHRTPAGFEMRLHVPSAPNWSRWGARVRELWRSATIDPCAGIRFFLPRL